jgi:hypothetical protein
MNRDSKRILKCIVSVLLLIAVNVAGQTVTTTVDPARNISGFSKYAWKENFLNARQSPEVNARMEKYLKTGVDSELAGKGYTLDSQAPEFFIHIEALALDDVRVSGNTDYRYPVGTTVYTSQMPDGLGVDILPTVIPHIKIIATEPSSDNPVWQVLAIKKYKNPDKAVRNMESEIGQIVRKAMKSFPSGKRQADQKK